MILRIVVCNDTFRLLADFVYKANTHWYSYRLADAMGYSEPELFYRVSFLVNALQEAKEIYKDTWIQMSRDNFY